MMNPSEYTTSTLVNSGGRVQHNCNTCGNRCDPATHVPGSPDCLDGAALRDESRSEW